MALKVVPEDGPSKVYYERCKYYIDNPPPEDWDGVFVMTTKYGDGHGEKRRS